SIGIAVRRRRRPIAPVGRPLEVERSAEHVLLLVALIRGQDRQYLVSHCPALRIELASAPAAAHLPARVARPPRSAESGTAAAEIIRAAARPVRPTLIQDPFDPLALILRKAKLLRDVRSCDRYRPLLLQYELLKPPELPLRQNLFQLLLELLHLRLHLGSLSPI